jgi:hypothetical protein
VVPHDEQLKHLRDRALLGLLGLQVLRPKGRRRQPVVIALNLGGFALPHPETRIDRRPGEHRSRGNPNWL